MMETESTGLPGVVLIKLNVHEDERGFFLETYNALHFAQAGIASSFIQDNHSGSLHGVLRGLHYQIQQAQGKLVQAITGEVFDVAVDLRQSSPTFTQWYGTLLSAENKHQLWIPPGFGHGFYVLSDWADVFYKVTEPYTPEWDRSLRWNDPTIGIEWPIPAGESPHLSAKDAEAPFLPETGPYP